jgi:hypothetical protein
LLYDEKATYTTPVPSALRASTRGYDDPNADIGFDDESVAFSEEDMPSKMSLDDDSDYVASPATSASQKRASNSSDSDLIDEKPHTVAPVITLPLSPANRARVTKEKSYNSQPSTASRWMTSALRQNERSYGERIKVSAQRNNHLNDLREQPSTEDKTKADPDAPAGDASVSVEYEESDESVSSSNDSPVKVKDNNNSTLRSN